MIKIVIENKKKKQKYENQRTFVKNLHMKDNLGIEFTAC